MFELTDREKNEWRAFTRKDVFAKGVAFLLWNRRTVRSGAEFQQHQMNFDTGYQAGYEEALKDIERKLAADRETLPPEDPELLPTTPA